MFRKILCVSLVFLFLSLSITSSADADWREKIFGGLERLGEKYREWRENKEIKKSLDLIRNEFQISKTDVSDNNLVRALKSPDPESWRPLHEVLKTKMELIDYGEKLLTPTTFPEPSLEKEIGMTLLKLGTKGALKAANVPAGSILDAGTAAQALAGVANIPIETRKQVAITYSEHMSNTGDDASAWKQTIETLEAQLNIRRMLAERDPQKQKEKEENLHNYAKFAYSAIETFRNAEKERKEIKELIVSRNEGINNIVNSNIPNVAKNVHVPIAKNESSKIPTSAPVNVSKSVMPPKTTLAPLDKDKLTGLDQKGGQQQLTPVKVTFTQTFNGLYTQTPIAPGSQIADFSGSITSGTRTGPSEVRHGNFTGSFSGNLTAYPGDTPGTYNSQPFNAWSVGTVEAKGFKEGTLKGTMNITGTLGGSTYKFPSGSVTINTDGSLSHTFNGVLKQNDVPWGTANGTLNQTPK